MRTVSEKRGNSRFLPFFCMAICILLLLAGLWPFDFFPENNVRWLPDQEVLRFGRYGIAYSPKPIEFPGPALDFRRPIQFTFKIRPGEEPGNLISRILSVCDEKSRELFFVGQWKNHLIIRLTSGDDPSSASSRETGVDNLFRKNRPVDLAVCLDESGVSLLADGESVKSQGGGTLHRFSGLRTRVLFLLGNSPAGDSPWVGDFMGISIRKVTAPQREVSSLGPCVDDRGTGFAGSIAVVTHYELSEKEHGLAFRSGGDSGIELFIPATFRPLKRTILFPPWKKTRFNRSFWWDVAVNVVGFVPFGFFFFAWLHTTREGKDTSTVFLVVFIGVGMSLAVELLQSYLPSRDPSLTDVLSNTLGSFVGVLLCRLGKRIRRRSFEAS